MNWTQQDAPLMDALKEHLMNRVVRFDVPGHKGGRGNHELADLDVYKRQIVTFSVFGCPALLATSASYAD